MNMTLNEQMTVKDGAMVERNFHEYPMLRIGDQLPKINVHFDGSRTFRRRGTPGKDGALHARGLVRDGTASDIDGAAMRAQGECDSASGSAACSGDDGNWWHVFHRSRVSKRMMCAQGEPRGHDSGFDTELSSC
jgi:hypothetical protein